MKLLLPTLILLVFSSCHGQKIGGSEKNEGKDYTDTDIVTSSIIDKKGNLWFGISTEGLYQYDGEKFSNFNVENGLCSNNITAIFQSSDGKIWFGGRRGSL